MEGPSYKEKLKLDKVKAFLSWFASPIKWVFIIALGIAIGGSIIFAIIGMASNDKTADSSLSDSSDSSDFSDSNSDNCNVVGINLHGTILTYVPEHAENDSMFDYDVTSSENVFSIIKKANEDEKIKSIVLEVDSAGGVPVAGEEIANAIKNSSKPVIGFIRNRGDSAAYWAISSADKIFASKNSDVGSIGVTASYLNNVENNKKEGYALEQLAAGKYKDAGSSDKPLTAEEKALFMRDINIIYDNFINDVAQNRKIPIEKVRSFADGSTVLGEKAKELGLIDEIGGISEVETYLEGVIDEKPEICW